MLFVWLFVVFLKSLILILDVILEQNSGAENSA